MYIVGMIYETIHTPKDPKNMKWIRDEKEIMFD